MVIIDSTMLLLFLRPDTLGPADSTGVPVTAPKDRVEHLISELEAGAINIMIPTPVLSEVLVRAGAKASQQIVEELNRQSVFRIEPFDIRAAIEVAAAERAGIRVIGLGEIDLPPHKTQTELELHNPPAPADDA